MPEEPYKNREIDEFRFDVRNSLQRIEIQTSLTNGRVNKLESWKWFISGGISVLTIIVVPILAWSLWVLVNIQNQVHGAVDQALSAYDIKIK